jgi:hypothetical protein
MHQRGMQGQSSMRRLQTHPAVSFFCFFFVTAFLKKNKGLVGVAFFLPFGLRPFFILLQINTHLDLEQLALNPVYPRRVDSSTLVFSFSSDRHSYIGLVFSSHFID